MTRKYACGVRVSQNYVTSASSMQANNQTHPEKLPNRQLCSAI